MFSACMLLYTHFFIIWSYTKAGIIVMVMVRGLAEKTDPMSLSC